MNIFNRAGGAQNQIAAARNATALMAVGAALGILIAGYGLFTAKGTVTHQVPAEDAALVNQRPILLSDFVAQAESTYAVPFDQITASQRKAILAAIEAMKRVPRTLAPQSPDVPSNVIDFSTAPVTPGEPVSPH